MARAAATRVPEPLDRNAVPLRPVLLNVLALLLAAAPAYRIVDLGAPPGKPAAKVEAVAINERGEVLLRIGGRGYLWRKGRFLFLGDPTHPAHADGDPRIDPTALNDRSVVVGSQGGGGPIFMTGLSDDDAFIWRGRGIEDLGTGAVSIPLAINNLGDVVGSGGHNAVARLKGRIVALPTMSAVEPRDPNGEMNDVNQAVAVAVNDRRQILLQSTCGRREPLPSRPFLIDGNAPKLRPRALPLPKGFVEAEGLALNQAGTVLAVAHEGSPWRHTVPYLLRGGRVVPLDLPGAAQVVSRADLNGRDDVVATSAPLSDQERPRPALWLDGRRVPFPRFAGWNLRTATGINHRRLICGTGLHNGKTRAYLLIPK